MFDPSPAPFALLQRVCSAVRAENCAAAERLVAIGELYALRMTQTGETQDWAVDATDAVTAEISAVLNVTRGLAASHLRYAQALRETLPLVGRAFIAGDLDERALRTVVHRTGLIVEDAVMAEVDRRLAFGIPRWGALNKDQFTHRIDQVVASVDLDAVRRRKDRIAEREVFVGDVDNGLAEIHATVTATDGHAFAERLTALARTVCEHDPRTVAARRADAVGAIAAGADRLACRCATQDCPAGDQPPASAVIIHVIADQATVDGTGTTPAVMIGYEGLIPPELIRKLAASARLRPLLHPTDNPPQAGYVPSQALADFVKCRDLTCRFPGCTTPATMTDIDHTIPHARGGPTQAGNLKCVCRHHHVVKTFWGWHDEQLRDGTVIWTAPDGRKYVTHPGSAYLFPELCAPHRTGHRHRPAPRAPHRTLRWGPDRDDAPPASHPRSATRRRHRRRTPQKPPTAHHHPPTRNLRRTPRIRTPTRHQLRTPTRPRPTTLLGCHVVSQLFSWFTACSAKVVGDSFPTYQESSLPSGPF